MFTLRLVYKPQVPSGCSPVGTHLNTLSSHFTASSHLQCPVARSAPRSPAQILTGFHIGSSSQVCRLRKSLYGLKQSARQWNKKLYTVLTELGFSCIESDRSVYIYSNGEVRIIVPIYIDDITLASKSPSAIDKYVQLLSQHFKCCDLGPTHFLLGVAVERDCSTCTLKLHQLLESGQDCRVLTVSMGAGGN